MDDMVRNLRKHWFVLALVAAGAAAWTTNTITVSYANDNIAENKAAIIKVTEQVDAVKNDINEINLAITGINVHQANMQGDISEIKGLIRDVAKSVAKE